MKTARQYNKFIDDLAVSDARSALDQISPLLGSLVTAASCWSFLRDGNERPLSEVIQGQLKHNDLI